MFRLRFTALAVAVLGFGLVSGCLNLCHHPFFGGRHAVAPAECCDIGAVPESDVAPGGSCCPAPGNAGLLPPPNMVPPGAMPQLTTPPGDRIAPIPRGAPTSPYQPQN